MRTHQEIVAEVRPAVLAKLIGVDPNTAKQWKRSDSIPAPYWDAVAKAGVASLEELAAAAAVRKGSHRAERAA